MNRGPLILFLVSLCAPLHAAPPITAIAVAPDGNSVVTGSQVGIEIRSLPDLRVGAQRCHGQREPAEHEEHA